MKWIKKIFERTIVRYVISYFGIYLVLIVAFFLVFKNEVIGRYYAERQRSIQKQIETVADNLYKDIDYLAQIKRLLYEDKNIIQSQYSIKREYILLAKEEMDRYTLVSDMIESVVYMPRISNVAYATNIPVFYKDNKFEIFGSSKGGVIFDPLPFYGAKEEQLIYLSNDKYQYLLYFPVCSSTGESVMFFILDIYELERTLNNVVNDEIIAIALMSPDGQIVAESNQKVFKTTEVECLLKDYISVQAETYNGYSLACLISKENMLNSINSAFVSVYAILIVIVIIGILLYIVAMLSTYSPLVKLVQKVMPEEASSHKYKAEYIKMLDILIEKRNRENQLLYGEFTEYKKTINNVLLESIVFSHGFANADIISKLEYLYEQKNPYEINIIYISAYNRSFNADEVCNYLLENLAENNSCIRMMADEKSGTFLLVRTLLHEERNNETDKNYLEEVKSVLYSLFQNQGYMSAISNSSSSILDIPYLYENAKKSKQSWSYVPVAYYDDIVFEDQELIYPQDKLQLLSQALETDNFDVTMRLLHELFRVLENISVSDSCQADYFIKSVLMDILQVICNVLNLNEIKIEDYNELYYETVYLCRSCSFASVKVKIRDNINNLLEYNAKGVLNRPINSKILRRIMLEYFDDPEFSIYYLSEKFHISVSHLSNIFKKEMGKNFVDYLWELRLKKTKELLLETDMSIDAISASVGYNSTSGFRKKFKADVGMTPAQYRDNGYKDNV